MEEAAAPPSLLLPTKVLRALDVSIDVSPSSDEKATRKGAHKEVEVDGSVPLKEVAEKPAPQLEWKKGVAGPRERLQNAGAVKALCLSSNNSSS